MAFSVEKRFADLESVHSLESGIEDCVNRRLEGTDGAWRFGVASLAFDGSKYGESEKHCLLSSKVEDGVAMRDGIRRMDLVMQADPATSGGSESVFERDGALDVRIENQDGGEPLFQVVNPAELDRLIGEAANLIGRWERFVGD